MTLLHLTTVGFGCLQGEVQCDNLRCHVLLPLLNIVLTITTYQDKRTDILHHSSCRRSRLPEQRQEQKGSVMFFYVPGIVQIY